ncbi:MAG: GntR family transcriptional regulator [Anaerolineales bacterium]|nr:GntR family transcriptional regulator [Anaerolineales bacterium]
MQDEKIFTKLELAARALRSAIIQGELKPGQKLVQQDLAEWLNMSATPVREVLRILETEGLVVHVPHKGVFVSEVSPEKAEEITPIRVALESLAVQIGVPNLTDEAIDKLEILLDEMEQAWKDMDLTKLQHKNYQFHSSLYRASNSEILCNMIERLWPMFATGILWLIPNRAQQTMEQHRLILVAIKERDAEKAAEHLAEHITSAGKLIVEFSRKQSISLSQPDLSSVLPPLPPSP